MNNEKAHGAFAMKPTAKKHTVGFRDAALRARIERFIETQPGFRPRLSDVIRDALTAYLDEREGVRADARELQKTVAGKSAPSAQRRKRAEDRSCEAGACR